MNGCPQVQFVDTAHELRITGTDRMGLVIDAAAATDAD